MKHKTCLACDKPLTGKQRLFCSRACGSRHRRRIKRGSDLIYIQMGQNKPNSEVKRVVTIDVTLRIANRLAMQDRDNQFIRKGVRMKLQPLLEDFWRVRFAGHYEPVRFVIKIESKYD